LSNTIIFIFGFGLIERAAAYGQMKLNDKASGEEGI